MRIALCLSGLPRCIRYSMASIRNHLIKPLNADVFVHTWDSINGKQGSHNHNRILTTDTWTEDSLVQFFNNEDIKDIEVASINDKLIISPKIIKKNLVSMFYSIYRCNELKSKYERDNNFKYDVVIRSRMDNFYNTNIHRNELEDVQDKKKIYVAVHVYENKTIYRGKPFVIDNFAFGTSEIMDQYSSVFLNIDNYLQITGVPESCLAIHLIKHHIKNTRSNIRMQFMSSWYGNQITIIGNYSGSHIKIINTKHTN